MIKCGHCKQAHSTIAAVRECSGSAVTTAQPVAKAQPVATRPEPFQGTTVTTARPVAAPRPATERQVSFVRDLAAKRDVPVAGKDQNEAWRIRIVECAQAGKDISFSEASDAIEWLKGLPVVATTTAQPRMEDHFDVPAGHYAVVSRTGNNDLDFFRVDRPTEGRWAGRTFVKRIIGGRPDVAVRGAEAQQALAAIVADSEAAARYGQTIGRCYRCNRHLTDELSRSLGIGPDCRSK